MEKTPAAPGEGSLLFPFALPDDSGIIFDVESLRQHKNLVVCFCRTLSQDARAVLQGIAAATPGIAAEEGVPFAVVPGVSADAKRLREEWGIPFQLLADESGKIIDSYCLQEVALYVTDRYREIFLARHGRDAVAVSGEAILDQLKLIEHQCPE